MGNRQRGGVDLRSARSVGVKGAPLKIFFVLSDDSHRSARLGEQDLPHFDPRPLLHPLFASISAPGGRALVPSISTQQGGTTPPPPLFNTTGRSAFPCCAFFPFFDATRCGPRLYVIFSSQWGGVHLLGVSSSLFPTQRGSVHLLSAFALPHSCQAQKDTLVGVFLCSVSFLLRRAQKDTLVGCLVISRTVRARPDTNGWCSVHALHLSTPFEHKHPSTWVRLRA